MKRQGRITEGYTLPRKKATRKFIQIAYLHLSHNPQIGYNNKGRRLGQLKSRDSQIALNHQTIGKKIPLKEMYQIKQKPTLEKNIL